MDGDRYLAIERNLSDISSVSVSRDTLVKLKHIKHSLAKLQKKQRVKF